MRIQLTLDKRPSQKDNKVRVIYDVSVGRSYRKRLPTGMRIYKEDWVSRAGSIPKIKKGHPLEGELNHKIAECLKMVETAKTKYDIEQWDESQVVSYLNGDTQVHSVEAFINSVLLGVKKKKSKTCKGYLESFIALRTYTSLSTPETPFKKVTDSLLKEFVANASKSLAPASIHSHLNRIRAVMNWAYDEKVIFDKFELPKGIKPKQTPRDSARINKPIKTCSPREFWTAIEKANTLRQWQSLGFWLLMFCMRGMYDGDIPNWDSSKLEDDSKAGLDKGKITLDELKSGKPHAAKAASKKDRAKLKGELLGFGGPMYLIHKRHKTKDTANKPMIIKIHQFPTWQLIAYLKMSVETLFRGTDRENLLGDSNDLLSIFSYQYDADHTIHDNLWSNYRKEVTKLLNYSFKDARKTFTSIALTLNTTETLRRFLIGHKDPSVLYHYDDHNKPEVRELVDDLHRQVLDKFEAETLFLLWAKRLEKIQPQYSQNSPKFNKWTALMEFHKAISKTFVSDKGITLETSLKNV